jgi:hypothetical protein
MDVDVSGDMSRPPRDFERRSSLPGVILHPDKEHTLYVVSLWRSKIKGMSPASLQHA